MVPNCCTVSTYSTGSVSSHSPFHHGPAPPGLPGPVCPRDGDTMFAVETQQRLPDATIGSDRWEVMSEVGINTT